MFGGQKNKKAEVLPPASLSSILQFPFQLLKKQKNREGKPCDEMSYGLGAVASPPRSPREISGIQLIRMSPMRNIPTIGATD